jgi:membrane protease YdiL (CAAX protease family)
MLAMHKLPGFHNPVLVADAHFSAHSGPFTQYVNFDKTAVGLILLATLCERARSRADLRKVLARALPIAIVGSAAVLGLALWMAYVKFDCKLPAYTPTFLLVNLLGACVAEEAFFRGVLQHRLAQALKKRAWGSWAAITISALLFGLAHIGGGTKLAVIAAAAGLVYAYSYHRTQKIEAAILAHFLLNALHFMFFSYPYVA